MKIHFQYTDGKDPHFAVLCDALDQFLNICAGGQENRKQYIPYNRADDIENVILAYDGEKPVGCAALKEYNVACAEVKRVFVLPDYRQQGVATKLLKKLEQIAKEQGYRYLLLESGEILQAAMILYRKIGFQIIPNYGPYRNMSDSVCLKKKI